MEDNLYRLKQLNMLKEQYESKISEIDLEISNIKNISGFKTKDLNEKLKEVQCGVEIKINHSDIPSNFKKVESVAD